MLQRVLMVVLILAVIVMGGLYVYKELIPPVEQEAQGPVYSTKEVVEGDLSVGVEVSGTLQPSRHGGLRVAGSEYNPMDSVQYILDEILVNEGDNVQQNQVVARLKSPDVENKIRDKQQMLASKVEQFAQMCLTTPDAIDSVNPARGITLTAPIEGRITGLDVSEGKKVSQGHIIANIVDDSKYKAVIKLFEAEYKKLKEGQSVVISFQSFSGTYDGVVTYLNPNRMPFKENDDFANTFVYEATVEGKNEGLVQPGMEVKVGIKENNGVHYFINNAKIEGFVKEEKIMNTLEAVVTKVHVSDMSFVKKGDPLITMAGTDVQKMIQDSLDEIIALRSETRDLASKLENLDIRAPMDGIVAGFYRQAGETLRSGEWVGSLYTTSQMNIWSEVDDIDILHVSQGAPVKVTVDALPNETFEGTVTNVSSMGSPERGVSKFAVEIMVIGGPQLKPGMQARAHVDAGSVQNVLLAPLEAIFEEDGKSVVEILNSDGSTKIVPVKLGLMNDRVAEIKEGLQKGDKVITGSSADILPSQRIKANDSILPDMQKDKDDKTGTENGGK